MTTRAVIENRQAFLFQDLGERFARMKFGDAVVDALPRFVRGKHKGKVKGLVRWKKVISGGWVREAASSAECRIGHVERRVGKVISAELCEAQWGEEPKVLHCWELEAERRTERPDEGGSPYDAATATGMYDRW